jgi:PadR family transcriptional regulator, regulatory protein AphA
MTPIKLTTPSYLVLGLVEQFEPTTPYDLKSVADLSVTKFWALPHTQIYAQCDRLTKAGLLSEEREAGGRRRRLLSLTPDGKAALDAWRAEPAPEPVEMRSLATLKLFFGADPAMLAADQIARHQAQLDQYLELEQFEMLPGQRLALEIGIGHEREFVRFWQEQAQSSG